MIFVKKKDFLKSFISRSCHHGLIFLCAVLPASVTAACFGDTQSKKIYSVSVVPQKTPSEIFSTWSALLDQIGKQTGMCFELQLQSTIPDFELKILAGDPDFAWMNPYHEVMAHKKQGYIPLVRDGKNLLKGLLVVRADSTINSVDMLKQARIAFPSPNAFAASLLIRATLDKSNLNIKPVYVKNHQNVYRATLNEDVQAGGGINSTLSGEPESLKKNLRILFETPGYAAHPLSANPRVPAEDQEAFTNAFLSLASTPQTARLLDQIPMPHPVRADYSRDYAPLESLNLEKYVVTASE